MTAAFGATLRELRVRPEQHRRNRQGRTLSQARLAEIAGLDHSYVSRLESGTRQPSRECVLTLAEALELSAEECDTLLVSAGFAPDSLSNLLSTEPLVVALYEVLTHPSVPLDVRAEVRSIVTTVVSSAQRRVKAAERIETHPVDWLARYSEKANGR